MSTFFVTDKQIKENEIEIYGEDYNHLKNVLRHHIGDLIEICNEEGTKFRALIKFYNQDCAVCSIEEIVIGTTELPFEVDLYQGLPKMDKLEVIIQKNTEMGISSVIPVETERSIGKINEKNKNNKLERWNKIAKEASKQCGRQKIPKVIEPMNFKNMIENISKYDIVLLLYENEKSITIKQVLQKLKKEGKKAYKIAIIIGPEGGFSKEEVSKLSEVENVQVVTVGARILRTETAGVVAMAMLNYEFEL